MRRVYGIWFLRRVVPVMAAEVLVLVLMVNLFANQVFVEEVLANTLSASVGNPTLAVGYLASAFATTGSDTQGVIVLLFLAGIFMLRDLKRAVVSYAVMKRNLPAFGRV